MSVHQSEAAIDIIHKLDTEPQLDVTLSFTETANVRTAQWATERFAGRVLVDKLITEYQRNPELDADGNPKAFADAGFDIFAQEEEALMTAADIAKDLEVTMKRLSRGYGLGHVTVYGTLDTSVIIGSLEKAVELPEEQLDEAEAHFQAAAQYMLDHMQVVDADISRSISYLL